MQGSRPAYRGCLMPEILIDGRWHSTEQTTPVSDRVEIAESMRAWLANIDAQRDELHARIEDLEDEWLDLGWDMDDRFARAVSRCEAKIESLDRLYAAGQRQLRSL